METTVIDTLRYADRLKLVGVESKQAEAMSRTPNDELAGGVATKDDLGRAVDELKGEIGKVNAKVDAIDAKFDHQGRYVFLMLALIAALGLYNAVAPHVAAKSPRTTGASTASAPNG